MPPRSSISDGSIPNSESLRLVLRDAAGLGAAVAGDSGGSRAAALRALLDGGYSVRFKPSGDGDAVAAREDVALVLELHEGGAAQREQHITGEEPGAALAAAREWAEEAGTPAPGAWKPWFPVIDFGRCTDCMQCLSFCLFDVYGVDAESHIHVKNPQNCKTNCPACSRVCPEVAIVFPKYGAGPINGAPVEAKDVEREKMKVDISTLLGGNIYASLRDRHEQANSRFSKERDEGKALKERLRCLKKIQADLDIPPEVLETLPAPDEIRARAREAAEEARRAVGEANRAGRPSDSPIGVPPPADS